jgi:hypothetical protein
MWMFQISIAMLPRLDRDKTKGHVDRSLDPGAAKNREALSEGFILHDPG